jgi:hypothetical protein
VKEENADGSNKDIPATTTQNHTTGSHLSLRGERTGWPHDQRGGGGCG